LGHGGKRGGEECHRGDKRRQTEHVRTRHDEAPFRKRWGGPVRCSVPSAGERGVPTDSIVAETTCDCNYFSENSAARG
jgi:hypothetical protein